AAERAPGPRRRRPACPAPSSSPPPGPRSRRPWERTASPDAWPALGAPSAPLFPGFLPSFTSPAGDGNRTNRTRDIPLHGGRRNPVAGSGDVARGFAGARLVMSDQVPDPARRREPPHLVRLDEQLGESSPQLKRLLRGEVHRQLVQEADELTHVRRSRDLALDGEPAFQLHATGAARGRSKQEVAQAVRTQADLSRHAS